MNRRPRLLDLFCKAGGAGAGYHAAGFDVVGVDVQPQPDYPFAFQRADALTVDLHGFDVIHASPPCQAYSCATPTDRRSDHPDLVAAVRARLVDAVTSPGGPAAYVIENVPGAPLHQPVTVCGDSLRLGVRRHRLFESNVSLAGTSCWHDRPTPAVAVYGSYGQRAGRTGSPASTEAARVAMGIDWMPWPALTQAIPPAYTHWLGVQLIAWLRDATPELRGCVTTGPKSAVLASPADATTAGGDATRSTGRDATHQDGYVTPPAVLRHCPCGKPLPARPVTGRWPRYCSQACRQAAYRTRHQGDMS